MKSQVINNRTHKLTWILCYSRRLPVMNSIKSSIKGKRSMNNSKNNMLIMRTNKIKTQHTHRLLKIHKYIQIKIRVHHHKLRHMINQHYVSIGNIKVQIQQVPPLKSQKSYHSKRLKVLLRDDFLHYQMQMKKLGLGILDNHMIPKKLLAHQVIQI